MCETSKVNYKVIDIVNTEQLGLIQYLNYT